MFFFSVASWLGQTNLTSSVLASLDLAPRQPFLPTAWAVCVSNSGLQSPFWQAMPKNPVSKMKFCSACFLQAQKFDNPSPN